MVERPTAAEMLALARELREVLDESARLRQALREILLHCGSGLLRCEACGTPETVSKMAAEALQGGK